MVSIHMTGTISAAPSYCVGLLTPASLAGDCGEPISRAQHPASLAGWITLLQGVPKHPLCLKFAPDPPIN